MLCYFERAFRNVLLLLTLREPYHRELFHQFVLDDDFIFLSPHKYTNYNVERHKRILFDGCARHL